MSDCLIVCETHTEKDRACVCVGIRENLSQVIINSIIRMVYFVCVL